MLFITNILYSQYQSYAPFVTVLSVKTVEGAATLSEDWYNTYVCVT